MLPPTLVAMTTRSLTPRDLSQCPIIASDSPPTFPGTQFEYMSAVSIKLYSASKRSSSRENDSVWFAVQPKTLPPKHRGGTLRPERSEAHTSELQSLLRTSSAVCSLKKQTKMTTC